MENNKISMHKLGAKLNYLITLRGECPEGYEITKHMNGGCVRCKQMQKGGVSLKKGPVKQRIHETDTVHTSKGIFNLSDKKLPYKKMTVKDYQSLPIDEKIKSDMKDLESGRLSEDPDYNEMLYKKRKKKGQGGSIKKRIKR